MLLQVAPRNGQYHEFWPWIPIRPILPICRNQSGFKSLNFVARVQEVAALHLQACFHQINGLETDRLQHMGNIGGLCIQGENSWYWPSRGMTWRSMGRALPGSFIKYRVRSFRDRMRHCLRADGKKLNISVKYVSLRGNTNQVSYQS